MSAPSLPHRPTLPGANANGPRGRPYGRIGTLVLALVSLGGLAAVVVLTGTSVMTGLRQALAPLGPSGVAAFLSVYILWNLTTVPALPMMTLGGVLYGPWMGSVWALCGSLTSAVITFSVGRRWGRAPLERLVARSAATARVLALVDRHPFLAVAVIRTAPIFPLSLLNYGLGATRMRFRTYLWSTFVMTLPGVALYTGAGDLVASAFAGERVGVEQVAWILGFAAVGLVLARVVKRRWPGDGAR